VVFHEPTSKIIQYEAHFHSRQAAMRFALPQHIYHRV
jgi:hypothetical protein